MKVLELEFSSAKVLYDPEKILPYKESQCLDMCIGKSGIYHEDSTKSYVPISDTYAPYIDKHTLINVLMVLVGEKPTSRRIYKDQRPYDKDCLEISKTARIEFTSKPYRQIFRYNKIAMNSWDGRKTKIKYGDKWVDVETNILSWERLYNYLGKDFYEYFAEVASKVTKQNINNLTPNRVFSILYDNKDSEEVKALTEKALVLRKKTLKGLIEGPESKIAVNAMVQFFSKKNKGSERVVKLVNSYPIYATVINGIIKIVVDDSFICRLQDGTGRASILEGGLVWIKSITDLDISTKFEPNIYPLLKGKSYSEYLLAKMEERGKKNVLNNKAK